MKTNFWLIITDGGSVRSVKNRPDVRWNEIAIQQTIELPDSLFQKPQLSATIIISDDVAAPKVIAPEIKDNIRNAIIEGAGVDVRITFPEDEV